MILLMRTYTVKLNQTDCKRNNLICFLVGDNNSEHRKQALMYRRKNVHHARVVLRIQGVKCVLYFF